MRLVLSGFPTSLPVQPPPTPDNFTTAPCPQELIARGNSALPRSTNSKQFGISTASALIQGHNQVTARPRRATARAPGLRHRQSVAATPESRVHLRRATRDQVIDVISVPRAIPVRVGRFGVSYSTCAVAIVIPRDFLPARFDRIQTKEVFFGCASRAPSRSPPSNVVFPWQCANRPHVHVRLVSRQISSSPRLFRSPQLSAGTAESPSLPSFHVGRRRRSLAFRHASAKANCSKFLLRQRKALRKRLELKHALYRNPHPVKTPFDCRFAPELSVNHSACSGNSANSRRPKNRFKIPLATVAAPNSFRSALKTWQ